jgi:hypothetical protein
LACAYTDAWYAYIHGHSEHRLLLLATSGEGSWEERRGGRRRRRRRRKRRSERSERSERGRGCSYTIAILYP